MTDHTTPDDIATDAPTESLTDPATLLDRDDVDYCEATFTHESEDHCEAGTAGRAIVGVTNEEGSTLLHVDEDRSAALVPNVTVEPGEDWIVAGRRAAVERTGVDVRVESPIVVRNVDHVLEGADDPFETTYHVVFRASPAADDADPVDPRDDADEDEWDVEWVDDLPDELENDGGPSAADVRLFVG